MSISNGVIESESINCHFAQVIGSSGMARIAHENFENIHLRRKDALATVINHIKTSQGNILVDPLMIFYRIMISKQSNDDLEANFKNELSTLTLSLFLEKGIRKETKSTFYLAFTL